MFADLSLERLGRYPGTAAIGVDVGGTKVALGLLDAATLTLLATRTIPTGAARGGEAVLSDVAAEVSALAASATQQGREVTGIGVGVPEIVDLSGRIISSAVIPQWDTLPVPAVLGQIAPARVEADVRAAAFAEAVLGAGRAFAYHVFLTVGTGISYSAVLGGRPVAGAHGGALNVGTSVLADALPEASPGRQATSGTGGGDHGHSGGRPFVLERVASGRALADRYVASGGEARRAEDVLGAAQAGDPVARQVVAEGARALGLGMALLLNLLDPEALIVGGGLGSADTPYWPAAQRWARHYQHRHAARTPLLRSELGSGAGVIGAGLAGLISQSSRPAGAGPDRDGATHADPPGNRPGGRQHNAEEVVVDGRQ
jgi:glucokinase